MPEDIVKTLKFFTGLLIAGFLTACASSGSLDRNSLNVVSEDAHFRIVRVEAGQTLEQIALLAYGDAAEVWQLEEANPSLESIAGALVAVPKRPLNVSGVLTDSYRTLPILCYHQFTTAERAAHRLELSASDFEAQLRFLREGGYQVLSFSEAADVFAGHRPMPDKAVVLTIDDGYSSVYDVAWPLLAEYGFKATLFVYTDFVGGGDALSWKQIQELSQSGLIEVESHGKSHASLSRLDEDGSEDKYRERLQYELRESEKQFERHLGFRPRYLSYPYGNSSDTIASMLKSSDYKLAATVTRGNNASYVDPFLVHRTMIYSDHSLADFERFVQGQKRRRAP